MSYKPDQKTMPEPLRVFKGLRKLEDFEDVGVYFLCTVDQVNYVGKSTQTRARIVTHKNAQQIPFDRVFFFPCMKHRLSVIEKTLINALRPSKNVRMALRGLTEDEHDLLYHLTTYR